MPPKSVIAEKLEKYRKTFGIDIFTYDQSNKGLSLFCNLCEESVRCERKSQLKQHIETVKHQTGIKREETTRPKRQSFLSNYSGESQSSNSFNSELCHALVVAGIPLHKLNNPAFKTFLHKWTREKVPDESTLRKTHIPREYSRTVDSIRSEIGNHPIWIEIDETTDVEGRCVGNFIVGPLRTDVAGRGFLLHTQVLQKVNHISIAKLINESLQILYPNGIKYERVRLLLTDAAAYMILAGKDLKTSYPNMIHLTCLAHALHRLAETIRASFPDVDKLIYNTKKVFVKAPLRIECFHTMNPGLPLPPEPVLTRWGTWLEAAIYYANNFDQVRVVIDSFDENDAASIHNAKELYRSDLIKQNLAYIAATFSFLPRAITDLESAGTPLTESIAVFERARNAIQSAVGPFAIEVRAKLDYVLSHNPGYINVNSIAKILAGTPVQMDAGNMDLSPISIASYKFAPVTSCDVERSFSNYKYTLSDRRRSFTFENLRMVLIVSCYYNPRDGSDAVAGEAERAHEMHGSFDVCTERGEREEEREVFGRREEGRESLFVTNVEQREGEVEPGREGTYGREEEGGAFARDEEVGLEGALIRGEEDVQEGEFIPRANEEGFGGGDEGREEEFEIEESAFGARDEGSEFAFGQGGEDGRTATFSRGGGESVTGHFGKVRGDRLKRGFRRTAGRNRVFWRIGSVEREGTFVRGGGDRRGKPLGRGQALAADGQFGPPIESVREDRGQSEGTGGKELSNYIDLID